MDKNEKNLILTIRDDERREQHHKARKGKSWSYNYGNLHPGCYNTPPLREDLVPRSRMAPERNGRGREEVKLSCFFDKRVKPMNLEMLSKMKERKKQR